LVVAKKLHQMVARKGYDATNFWGWEAAMKRLLLAGVALAVIGAPALGADMAVKAPVYKAPVIALWSWTGPYIGGNGGYSWGRSRTDITLTDNVTGAVLASQSETLNLNGAIGGGQIGYNWQWDRWVWGVEADIQASGQRDSTTFICPAAVCAAAVGAPDVVVDFDQKLKWFGTVRGRLGITGSPIMAYVTGGLAYGSIKTAGTITGGNINLAAVATSFSVSETKVGWVVGAGVEGQISGNWTGKIEYLYMDLGTVSGGPFVTTIAPVVRANFLAASFSSKITDHILRAGLNYKF
jgi:outer membrane immunogenic protein